jgi:hypothetical protein
MNKLLYNVMKATVVIEGGVVVEDFQVPSVDWFAFYGLLMDDTANFLLNDFALTDLVTTNDQWVSLDDNVPGFSGGDSANPSIIFNQDEDTGTTDATVTQAQLFTNTTQKKRAFPETAPIRVSNGPAPILFANNGINYVPFHLRWISNLWAKSGLSGLCGC